MSNLNNPIKVFLSYSHKDKKHKENIVKHLSSLIRQKYIELWYDSMILPGESLDKEITEALNESEIVVLLVSADYLNSYYCYSIELKKAIERKIMDDIEVVPIMVRPTDLAGTPFEGLKALPEDRKAITTFNNQDVAYEDVAKGIRKVVERMLTTNINGSANNNTKTVENMKPSNHTNNGVMFQNSNFYGEIKINTYNKENT